MAFCKTFSNKAGQEQHTHVCCPVCGSDAKRYAFTLGESCFVRCRSCFHLHQSPAPVQKDLIKRYDSDYLSYELENEEAFYALMQAALRDVKLEQELQARGMEGGKMLDIGCATGKLLDSFSRKGWDVAGVEVCTPSAEYARKKRGLQIYGEPLEKLFLDGDSYDFLHASHLIEHLEAPRDFVRECHRLLSLHGLLALTTPNAAGLQARLFGSRWRSAIEDHIHLFSLRNLSHLLEQEGFRILSQKTWGGLAQGLAPLLIKRWADYWAKRFGFGDVMVILAEKI